MEKNKIKKKLNSKKLENENANFDGSENGIYEKDKEKIFIKEQYSKILNEEDEKNEIIRSIINTRKELLNIDRNFDFVNNEELIDYYIYKIKSIQSKLNNLIKLAKEKGIEINKIA